MADDKDTWKKYDKTVVEAIKDHPSIINAIHNMKQKGYEKETAQRITGAPYEVVERVWHRGEKK